MVAVSLALAYSAQGQAQSLSTAQREARDPAAVARLVADSGGNVQVSIHDATGAARFVWAPQGGRLGAASRTGAMTEAAKRERSIQFLATYGSAFGVSNAASELAVSRVETDRLGATHITHKQMYQGLPVFGAELKTHFDAAGQLTVVNGTFVPGISVAARPTRSAEEAGRAALARVQADLGRAPRNLTVTPTLMIFREGLAKGVDGENHLAWQVEVGNRADVREFVYVDAHSGKVIDRISGIHEAKNRRAYDAQGATAPGPNYPATPFWVEGQTFPTGVAEADNMIAASSEVYDLFKRAFGRDSYNGSGAVLDSVFNRGNGCPNASWNGTLISFCPGTTTDDVTAHEWGHAYTEYTHGLIYQWQPGALNEAYSDIWGETVDRINGRGTDTPDNPRTAGQCTVFTSAPPTVNITAPAAIAGIKATGSADFGAQTFNLSNSLVGVDVGSAAAGCTLPFAVNVTGKIAFIDRGTCGFAVKALNAQQSGAVAVIIGNNQLGTVASNMTGGSVSNTIPTVMVTQNDGTAIKAQLALTTVSASLSRGPGTDNSVRWLMGEDSSAFGGAIRDMYNPTCYGNPGKVSDTQYTCSTADAGGVHGNSGVPNHGYALLVDGGTYNGQTVAAIGLTKSAHIYYRAQSVYQGPASNFADHADALARSCTDLTGSNLNSLTTGLPSGEVISAADCQQVAKMALAVELRTPPTQCNFTPLLAQSPPALCTSGTVSTLASDAFDPGVKRDGIAWQFSNVGSTGTFTPRNWNVVSGLPGGRRGSAMFAVDPNTGDCSANSQAGVIRLDSPAYTVPANGSMRLAFDHFVATELDYDGGNLKISVNGGPFTLVAAADFIYNPYNKTLPASDNPLSGQPAFTGADGGSVTGSWGRSIVNLTPYATPGQTVRLRYEFGTDGCGGTFGWYIDEVRLYSCVAP
jgi:Zn-dependent metalloprotease